MMSFHPHTIQNRNLHLDFTTGSVTASFLQDLFWTELAFFSNSGRHDYYTHFMFEMCSLELRKRNQRLLLHLLSSFLVIDTQPNGRISVSGSEQHDCLILTTLRSDVAARWSTESKRTLLSSMLGNAVANSVQQCPLAQWCANCLCFLGVHVVCDESHPQQRILVCWSFFGLACFWRGACQRRPSRKRAQASAQSSSEKFRPVDHGGAIDPSSLAPKLTCFFSRVSAPCTREDAYQDETD